MIVMKLKANNNKRKAAAQLWMAAIASCKSHFGYQLLCPIRHNSSNICVLGKGSRDRILRPIPTNIGAEVEMITSTQIDKYTWYFPQGWRDDAVRSQDSICRQNLAILSSQTSGRSCTVQGNTERWRELRVRLHRRIHRGLRVLSTSSI
jgi:hypothetical protein